MKIAFLTHCPVTAENGGVERVTSILGASFKGMGHDVFFCCLSQTTPKNVLCHENGIPQMFFSTSDNSITDFRNFINEYKIDVLINQIAGEEILPLLECVTESVKVISVFHNMPFGYSGKVRKMFSRWYPTSILGKMFKVTGLIFPGIVEKYYYTRYRSGFEKMMRVSDKYCLLSELFKADFFKKMHAPELESKVIAINNPNTFNTVPINYEKKRNEVLYVGRIYELSKNVHDLLDAWGLIANQNPEWWLCIVGDGPDLMRLKTYVFKRKIHNVRFEGHQTDVSKYYAAAKIFAMTSICEGWGMVLTEAMAYGCAVCCYDTFDAANDIIENNVTGYIVPRFDVVKLSEKIQYLINNPTVCESMGTAGKKRINKFAIKAIADQWQIQFAELMR